MPFYAYLFVIANYRFFICPRHNVDRITIMCGVTGVLDRCVWISIANKQHTAYDLGRIDTLDIRAVRSTNLSVLTLSR